MSFERFFKLKNLMFLNIGLGSLFYNSLRAKSKSVLSLPRMTFLVRIFRILLFKFQAGFFFLIFYLRDFFGVKSIFPESIKKYALLAL